MLCKNFKLRNGRNLLGKKLSQFLALSAKVYSAKYFKRSHPLKFIPAKYFIYTGEYKLHYM